MSGAFKCAGVFNISSSDSCKIKRRADSSSIQQTLGLLQLAEPRVTKQTGCLLGGEKSMGDTDSIVLTNPSIRPSQAFHWNE